jgi:acetyl-CoA carboxylase biotin carboxyl carrier protein
MATKKTAKKKPAKKAPKKTVKKMAKKPVKKSVKKVVKKAVKKTVKKAAPKAAVTPVQSPRLQEVQQLMEMMVAHGVTMLDLSDAKRSFILERGHVAPVAMGAAPAPIAAAPLAAPAAAAAEPEDDGLLEILSPMVGTFYTAPSPDSPAFAKTGDVIHGESVVCIVEAMKVMNEIKAELSGTIVEICVENAQPVEFGQVLFKVKA